jgi:hypothetical protein
LSLTQSQASRGQVAMQKKPDAWVTSLCRACERGETLLTQSPSDSSMRGADRSFGLTQSQASCGQVPMQKTVAAWVTKLWRE